jgi:ribosomal-protein-alanine N-acetyltransferase
MIGLFANRMPGVRVDGPHVYIRPPRRRDERQWVEIRRVSREFLIPWEPSWPSDATTGAAFRRRYRRFCDDWRTRTGFAFFVFEQGSDRLLGGITLSNVRRGVSQSGSIGYWMGKPYAGKGYMSEAVGLILHFSFETLNLNRVEAACLLHNEPSRSLLRKLGFTEEGVARRYLCINGRWQDHVTYAILRDDPRPSTARRTSAVYA